VFLWFLSCCPVSMLAIVCFLCLSGCAPCKILFYPSVFRRWWFFPGILLFLPSYFIFVVFLLSYVNFFPFVFLPCIYTVVFLLCPLVFFCVSLFSVVSRLSLISFSYSLVSPALTCMLLTALALGSPCHCVPLRWSWCPPLCALVRLVLLVDKFPWIIPACSLVVSCLLSVVVPRRLCCYYCLGFRALFVVCVPVSVP